MKSEKKMLSYFTNGILKENPVLRLVLGTCPTLAVTTSLISGLGMGVAATVVLVCSNLVISLLRNVIPNKIRIPAFITIIAGFVTIVQMLLKAFAPSINAALGIYLPLIVVNCIILARAETFACKNSVLPSILDGLGMGIGFTCILSIMGLIREILGTGAITLSESLVIPVTSALGIQPILIFILPPGAFFVFGMLIALSNRLAVRKGKKPVNSTDCDGCPSKSVCELLEQDKQKKDEMEDMLDE